MQPPPCPDHIKYAQQTAHTNSTTWSERGVRGRRRLEDNVDEGRASGRGSGRTRAASVPANAPLAAPLTHVAITARHVSSASAANFTRIRQLVSSELPGGRATQPRTRSNNGCFPRESDPAAASLPGRELNLASWLTSARTRQFVDHMAI